MGEFSPMGTFPKDGTRCQIKFDIGVVSMQPFYWGDKLMGVGQCIRGDQNEMSPYLVPMGWREWKDEYGKLKLEQFKPAPSNG